ncbi:hypothetical protein [Conexibacter sp. CPCC 206217]|uniref:hypothetical protein n=1 Tax=Conexibacter sp. CPCC 206217 TaxID=3064574 RepID=UPI00271A5BA2|nr:hypothetical protein [Conexibacter sp. CPCC 206217]MDO8213479.1 hypothetical protein [Conexibacter sp. CPCC 206217]
MSRDSKPLGQVYYEAVEALTRDGMSQADAIRSVAEQQGKRPNAVRGSVHAWRLRHVDQNGTSNGNPRRRSRLSVDDHIGRARQSLEEARDLIQQEVAAARSAVDTASAHYEEVSTTAEQRLTDIDAKLTALA